MKHYHNNWFFFCAFDVCDNGEGKNDGLKQTLIWKIEKKNMLIVTFDRGYLKPNNTPY